MDSVRASSNPASPVRFSVLSSGGPGGPDAKVRESGSRVRQGTDHEETGGRTDWAETHLHGYLTTVTMQEQEVTLPPYLTPTRVT